MTLPIDSLLPELLNTLSGSSSVVVQAPPGAGKTTRVPLALLEAGWVCGKKIVMLEPRRLAARAAARFMAASLGEAVGGTVGYRVRQDSKIGSATRLEVVTEGVLTRMLQDDPALESVAAVIFDEFHERNLQSDLGLALCRETQSALRPDLRLLVMSATLDGERVARLLGEAPILTSSGRSYPVDIRYRPTAGRFSHGRRAFCEEVARAILVALGEESGSVLVFLPGIAEIRQVEAVLGSQDPGSDVTVIALHGQLAPRDQDMAIRPPPDGRRKVVLATSIAETSLTIDGVRVVIDGGLIRSPRFHPGTGLDRLETLPVTRASADQRCGRAGRQQAGVCYRLWSEHQHLVPHGAAEILHADLAPLVLELAQWGVSDVDKLCWLDRPPDAHLGQASGLLTQLGALKRNGQITPHGRAMTALGVHPRLAHMMLCAADLDCGTLGCEIAALIAEPDPLRGSRFADADIVTRIELLRGLGKVDTALAGRFERSRIQARRWQAALQCEAAPADNSDLSLTGVVLGFAYPDRIGQRRKGSGQRFLLSSGRGARFAESEPLAAADYVVAAHLDGTAEARIFLAAAVYAEDLLRFHANLVAERCSVRWDDADRCVQARRQLCLGELVIQDEPWQQADAETVKIALLEGIQRHAPACLPWTDAARKLQARVSFLHRMDPRQWPDLSDTGLMSSLDDWLAPYLNGMNRLTNLRRLDLGEILLATLSWPQRKKLDELAPSRLSVPSGSRIEIDYSHETPVLAVRLQEMFGVTETPSIAGGRVPVLLHLLSPARRPVQITRDLGTFWAGSYQDVRKELKGRYPKHYWPDDPLSARASSNSMRKK